MTEQVPVPPYIPVLSHVVQIDRENPDKTFNEWRAAYGEIYQIYLLSERSCIQFVRDVFNLCTVRLVFRAVDYGRFFGRTVRRAVQ